jgi:pimeloyl-ACP methyl ester carboxylesterase
MQNLPELLCRLTIRPLSVPSKWPFTAIGDGRAQQRHVALRWPMLDRSPQTLEHTASAQAAPLVMLPGTLCDARLFEPVLDQLGCRAQVPVLGGATSAVAIADAVLATSPERFSLCGFSLGAIVALEIAARAPARVERLALIGCNPGVLSNTAARDRAALSSSAFVEASYHHADPDVHAAIEDMAAATSSTAYREQTLITLTRADSRPGSAACACRHSSFAAAKIPSVPRPSASRWPAPFRARISR